MHYFNRVTLVDLCNRRSGGDMCDRSAKSMKPARISFYGNFGASNLGNECTLQAVIEQILRRWPDAQLLCFCPNPQDVRTRHNIAAFPSDTVDKTATERFGSTYIFGAVCPKEGKGAALIMPACN